MRVSVPRSRVPERRAPGTLCAVRAVRTTVDRARRRLDELNTIASDDHMAALVAAAAAARSAQSALEAMTRETLATEALGGVGGDAWHELWAAAETYSLTAAYQLQRPA